MEKTTQKVKVNQLVGCLMEQDAGMFCKWKADEWGPSVLEIRLLYDPSGPVESVMSLIDDDLKELRDTLSLWLHHLQYHPDQKYWVFAGKGRRRESIEKSWESSENG